MKIENLVNVLVSSIDDKNLSSIFDNFIFLAKTPESRWLVIWNWVKDKLMGLLFAAAIMFPEVRKMKQIFDSLKIMSEYSAIEKIKLTEKMLDSITVNYKEIEEVCEFKSLAAEITLGWPQFRENMNSNPAIAASGLDFESPKEFFDSLSGYLKDQDPCRVKIYHRLAYLVDVFSTNF